MVTTSGETGASFTTDVGFPDVAPFTTDLEPETGASSDPVIGTYLQMLRRYRVPVKLVSVAMDGAYRIYTEIDTKSPTALDRVYKAEVEAEQKLRQKSGVGPVLLVFRHRNAALEGSEEADEFLERGAFVKVSP
jgi:hypothetical protein